MLPLSMNCVVVPKALRLAAHHPAVQRRWRRRFSELTAATATATATATTPPAAVQEGGVGTTVPIQWTTHRLSTEQIQKVDGIFHKILWLDLFEVSMLTDCMNERLGIHLTPPQRQAIRNQIARQKGGDGGTAAAHAGAASGAPSEQESVAPKKVDLKLAGFDEKAKIKVIKEVRAIVGLGLKEAKELVESAPKVLQKDLTPEQADELKARLEAVGATIELV